MILMNQKYKQLKQSSKQSKSPSIKSPKVMHDRDDYLMSAYKMTFKFK